MHLILSYKNLNLIDVIDINDVTYDVMIKLIMSRKL